MASPQPDGMPRLDLDAALNFLFDRFKALPIHLARLNPHKGGPPKCKQFPRKLPDGTPRPIEEVREEVRAWIEEWNGRKHWNVYFTLGDLRHDIGDVKPSETDVRAVRYMAVDLDPRKIPPDWKGTGPEWVEAERERILPSLTTDLPEGVPGPPTFVIDSGGGYWGLWRLNTPFPIEEPEEDIASSKAHRAHLIELYRRHFGEDRDIVDGVANLERLCRLPGTVNYPDRKKREEKGREAAPASLLEEACSGKEYLRANFKPPESAAPVGVRREFVPSGDVRRFESVDEIPELQAESDARNAKCRVCIVQGHDPDAPPKSRSEPLLFVCCQMVRAKCSDETIFSVITDPEFAISDAVLTDSNRRPRSASEVERYAARQIDQAHTFVDAEATEFQKDKDGKLYKTLHNVRLAISKLGVMLEFDEFAERMHVFGLDGFGPHLDDAAVNRMWLGVEERFGLSVGKDRFLAIVQDIAMLNRRHPVREFLDSLKWDGEPRLDRWLTTYIGVEGSDYTRAVGTIVIVAAVRRIREPGCKFDEMLVLEGPQGTDKSSALRVLAVRPEWFTDDLTLNAKAQEFIEQTLGKWIVEAGELKGMRKGEVEVLKATLSRQRDRARMAYGRLPLERLRQFVMFGTTNADKYLKDSTGNRRFWPVKTGAVDLDGLRRDREQLWAEAAAREAAGESIRLAPSLYASAAREQEGRRVEEPWVQVLDEALRGVEGKLRTEDAWLIVGVAPERREQVHCERIGTAMRELGWERKQRRFGGPPEYAYVKGDGRVPLEVTFDDRGQAIVREVGSLTDEEAAAYRTFGGGGTT